MICVALRLLPRTAQHKCSYSVVAEMWYVRQSLIYVFDDSGINIQNRISAYKI